ncbi:2-phosphosulfolactate phosphatase (modular protein) [uncultured Desulfatiglans sp.]|nr:2-phosphosulfolactate phosphatase (modular protein) [uncultured Desulfatiglans sp.]
MEIRRPEPSSCVGPGGGIRFSPGLEQVPEAMEYCRLLGMGWRPAAGWMALSSCCKMCAVPPGGDVAEQDRWPVLRMKVIRKRLADGARGARGTVVVIDVFRAFSCTPLFFYFGASKVMLEADPLRAVELKRFHPDAVLVGEVDEVPIEGGDMGNSPSRIIAEGARRFEGRTVIHRTTAGVTGVSLAAASADEVILGSFVTASAIAEYLKGLQLGEVTLVAMGDRALRPAPEDEACADYLEHLLNGTPYDPVKVFREVVFQPTAQKFLTRSRPYLPPEDPLFCLQRDLFDAVPIVAWDGDRLVVRPPGC